MYVDPIPPASQSLEQVLRLPPFVASDPYRECRAVVYLTGFGGHEQQLLLHVARTSRRWHLIIVTERPHFAAELKHRLPSNARIIAEHALPAYPALMTASAPRSIRAALAVARSLPAPLDLVSTGDIGNFYLLTLALAFHRALPPVYAPMAPPVRNLPVLLARRVIWRLITCSSAELRKFRPPAHSLLDNLPPGHLRKLRMTPSESLTFELFWIGRFDERQKRPERALEIMDKLKKEFPHLPVKLNYVGDGPALPSVRLAVACLGLDAAVRFWGWLNFDAPLPPLVPPIHALLNTSDYEGVPLTMLDALEIGVPCVFRRGAVEDERYRGMLHEWSTPADAVEIIASLATTRPIPP